MNVIKTGSTYEFMTPNHKYTITIETGKKISVVATDTRSDFVEAIIADVAEEDVREHLKALQAAVDLAASEETEDL